jgi:hypothetical protein
VAIRSMQCTHSRMLFAPHAADLAKILAEAIGRDDAPQDFADTALALEASDA